MGVAEWVGVIVAIALGLPLWILNMYKYFKERKTAIIEKASPELMVVGVAGGLANSLMEALTKEREESIAKDRRIDELERKYWEERNRRIELEDKLLDVERRLKWLEGGTK